MIGAIFSGATCCAMREPSSTPSKPVVQRPVPKYVQGRHRPERNVGFAAQDRPHAGCGLYQRRGRDRLRQRLIIAARLRSREPCSAFRTSIAHGSLTSQVKQGCFR